MRQTGPLFPVFLKLAGRRVLLVGGGPTAAGKLDTLLAAGAAVTVVAPGVMPAMRRPGVEIRERPFIPADVDGAWLVVAAATPDVNRRVAAAAEARRVFVNAVDDPANATAYLAGVVRKGGVTLAVSTNGAAPALAGLLREALEAVLPDEVGKWLAVARALRPQWRECGVAHPARRPLLLEALNRLYAERERAAPGLARHAEEDAVRRTRSGRAPARATLTGRRRRSGR